MAACHITNSPKLETNRIINQRDQSINIFKNISSTNLLSRSASTVHSSNKKLKNNNSKMNAVKKELANSWAESFENLMNCKIGARYFEKFLNKIYANENLEFYQKIVELEEKSKSSDLSVSGQDLLIIFNQIYTDFIADSVINLNSGLFADFKSKHKIYKENPELLKQEASSCLSTQKDHVYKLMKSDSYPRFLKSDIYLNTAENTSPTFESDTIGTTQSQSLALQPQPIKNERITLIRNSSTFAKFRGRLSLSKGKLPGRENVSLALSQTSSNLRQTNKTDPTSNFSTDFKVPETKSSIEAKEDKSSKFKKSTTSYSTLRRLTGNFSRYNKSGSNILNDKKLVQASKNINNSSAIPENEEVENTNKEKRLCPSLSDNNNSSNSSLEGKENMIMEPGMKSPLGVTTQKVKAGRNPKTYKPRRLSKQFNFTSNSPKQPQPSNDHRRRTMSHQTIQSSFFPVSRNFSPFSPKTNKNMNMTPSHKLNETSSNIKKFYHNNYNDFNQIVNKNNPMINASLITSENWSWFFGYKVD